MVGCGGFYPKREWRAIGCVILSGMRIPLALAAPACVLLLAPGAAGAASVTVDERCHRAAAGREVSVAGGGFDPLAEVEVKVGGSLVATDEADASGDVRISFPVPVPPLSGPARGERAYELSLTQGAKHATTTLRVALPIAAISPTTGSPRSARVRFTAIGFGAGERTMPTIYVHYVDPAGRHARTFSLGRGAAPCGTIKRSSPRRLFAFAPRKGTWTLQLDTRRGYRRATEDSGFAFAKIRLRVR